VGEEGGGKKEDLYAVLQAREERERAERLERDEEERRRREKEDEEDRERERVRAIREIERSEKEGTDRGEKGVGGGGGSGGARVDMGNALDLAGGGAGAAKVVGRGRVMSPDVGMVRGGGTGGGRETRTAASEYRAQAQRDSDESEEEEEEEEDPYGTVPLDTDGVGEERESKESRVATAGVANVLLMCCQYVANGPVSRMQRSVTQTLRTRRPSSCAEGRSKSVSASWTRRQQSESARWSARQRRRQRKRSSCMSGPWLKHRHKRSKRPTKSTSENARA
jgi:hypothetical protein